MDKLFYFLFLVSFVFAENRIFASDQAIHEAEHPGIGANLIQLADEPNAKTGKTKNINSSQVTKYSAKANNENMSFCFLSLWLDNFKVPDFSKKFKVQINLNQTSLLLSYQIKLHFNKQEKIYTVSLQKDSIPQFTITYFSQNKGIIIYQTKTISADAEVLACDNTELYGAMKGKHKVSIDVLEKVYSEEATFFDLKTFETIAEINMKEGKIKHLPWKLILHWKFKR